jgi:signal transduction histidine kinase
LEIDEGHGRIRHPAHVAGVVRRYARAMNRLLAGAGFPRVDPRFVDVTLAVAAAIVGQLDVWSNIEDGGGAVVQSHHLLVALLSFIGMSMLLLRRRAPLAGLAVMLATLIVQTTLVDPVAFFFGGFVPVLFMIYAVGAYVEDLGRALAGLGMAIVGASVVMLTVPDLRTADTLIFNLLTLPVSWAIGYRIGSRGRRADALAKRADELERERDHTVADERARLARELHDIVAHSVSIIAIQAEAGEALLDEPERAAEAFRSIQSTSRQALTELRRQLELLREVEGEPGLAPQPGLSEVADLIERVRAAGLETDLAIDGAPTQIDPGVDLSAYRIVQEALTNSLKHGGAARARVQIHYLPGAIELEVADNGAGSNGVDGSGSGRGLIGMRERVALYGGEVSARPGPEGGFAVRARLPLERS